MTWAPWLWLALAVAALPGVPAMRARAGQLRARGRLGAPGAQDPAVDHGTPPGGSVGGSVAGGPADGMPAGPATGPPRAAVVPGIVAGVMVPAVGCAVLAGPAIGAAALVAAATAARLGLAAHQRRRRERSDRQLLAALRLAAAELEAGTAPPAALRAAAQVAPLHAADLGATATALGSGAAPRAAGALGALAPAWQLAVTTGAPLAEVCGRVARDLAARIDQRGAVATALAGARSSAGLLAVLPVLGLALGSAMQAAPVTVLVTTPTGHALLVVGVVLDATGLLWTHRLASGGERS